MNKSKRLVQLLIMAAVCILNVTAADTFVSFGKGDVKLCTANEAFSIGVSDNDNIGVKLAAKNLCTDFGMVCGAKVSVTADPAQCRIVIGTVGSSMIDALAKAGKIDTKELKGKREKYIIGTTEGDNSVLYIAGSDRRGTIYGIYELSRQMGVSPWYYWMDVPVKKQQSVYVQRGQYTDGEPAVRYRGIFLNDEAPCLTSWVKNTFGTGYGDHRFYAKVFELLLRLKGNYIWPAMWGWAFYADDPLNSKTADDMGIMVGTSHHEPMSRSQKEWHGHSDNPNVEPQDLKSRQEAGGKWDYATNKENLDRFWLGGVERNKHTEDIITIGMRGDGDMAMSEERNVKLLETVVKNQRKLISKAHGKPAKDVPQLWALYKEVQDYYDDGMRVPEDVTMLLCDDNWGDVRRVPTAKERQRKGGWGLYYHVDYVGAPRNSKLINATPTQNMWEQLTLAYDYGIDRLWILNVGDLKPMEYQIQLFLDMAWNPKAPEFIVGEDNVMSALTQHTRQFCAQQFGDSQADEAARILNLCCKMNGRCTAEMLDATTYDLASGEWQRVVDEYKDLEIAALRQYATLEDDAKDAYFQLILFPVQLMANLHQMYHAQAMNLDLHRKGDCAMNKWADKCEEFFNRDARLMAQYNKEIAGGKWNGMMTQKHIGYTSWNDSFKKDILPKLFRAEGTGNVFSDGGKGYIAMEAEHFQSKADGAGAKWTLIPQMGRTLGAMTLMPQTGKVDGASLTYSFTAPENAKGTAKVHIVTKSTLDFLNKGGLTYSVAMDGAEPATVNFNSDMNENPENIYNVYYPTIARRVIEKTVELSLGNAAGGVHRLTFTPNDPGIVLEKIVIDFGGYTKQYLFGEESPRIINN